MTKMNSQHHTQIVSAKNPAMKALDHKPIKVCFTRADVFTTTIPPLLPRLLRKPKFDLPIAKNQLQAFTTQLMHKEDMVIATTTPLRQA